MDYCTEAAQQMGDQELMDTAAEAAGMGDTAMYQACITEMASRTEEVH